MSEARKHAHLTEEELSEFREIFNLVDLDKGGTISKEELRQLMTTLGLKPSQASPLNESLRGVRAARSWLAVYCGVQWRAAAFGKCV